MTRNAGVLGESRHGTTTIGLSNAARVEGTFGIYPVGVVDDGEPESTKGEAIGVEAISARIPNPGE